MTENRPATLSPSACFVVEREASKGYQITSAEGPYAETWKERALALLDTIGQPDPKGPEEYFRWIGPITPSRDCVGVIVRLMPNGEARYHQAWFRFPITAGSRTRTVALGLIFSLVVFAGGAYAGRILLAPRDPAAAGVADSNNVFRKNGTSDSQPNDPLFDSRITRLENGIAASREVRENLKHYLAQKGLAANMSEQVVTERNSVYLLVDRLIDPKPQETLLYLSNVDVAKLTKLLATLDEWTTNQSPQPATSGK